MYNLKFHPRLPVNFTRIPDNLCVEIFVKHSGIAICRSTLVCQCTNKIIEATLVRTPILRFLASIFAKYEITKIFRGFVSNLFKKPHIPLSELVLCCVVALDGEGQLSSIDPQLYKEFKKVYNAVVWAGRIPVDVLWSEQNRHGPRGIDLVAIPQSLRNVVLSKTITSTLQRLRPWLNESLEQPIPILFRAVYGGRSPTGKRLSRQYTSSPGGYHYLQNHGGTRILTEEEMTTLPYNTYGGIRTLGDREEQRNEAWLTYGHCYNMNAPYGF